MKIEELFGMKNRVVIITGAAGRLGKEHSDILSEAGANVVMIDLKDCSDIINDIKDKYNTNPSYYNIDITNKEQVISMVDKVINKYGRIDVLINNAMYSIATPTKYYTFEEYPLDLWNDCISVNLTAMFLLTQAIGKQMLKQGYGNIINIASMSGIVGTDHRIYGDSKINSPAVYGATKAGVIHFTKYMAAYWEGKNIRVNSLSPGGIYDNHSEEFVKNYGYKSIIHRMANRKEMRGPILFLASDASSFMTGANLIVDGGWTAW